MLKLKCFFVFFCQYHSPVFISGQKVVCELFVLRAFDYKYTHIEKQNKENKGSQISLWILVLTQKMSYVGLLRRV